MIVILTASNHNVKKKMEKYKKHTVVRLPALDTNTSMHGYACIFRLNIVANLMNHVSKTLKKT